ncbi:MAG: class I SAM-dependent methyltransferase [Bacteroidia bacterium]|nr:class I SAM-dependent methyltransferase [Bacteroidia bacterium]
MPKWILKAIVQKSISYLPYSHKINFLFQKYITKGVQLTDAYFEDKLIHAAKHLEIFKKQTQKNYPESLLELGTGWYPVVPLAFWLSGTKNIFSIDISALMNKERFLFTLKKFLEWERSGKLSEFIQPDLSRLELLKLIFKHPENKPLNDWLQEFSFAYLVTDAAKLNISGIEFISSNNVLEHIYPQYLKPILKNLYFNVLAHKGIMYHFIDMSDHFAHTDKSITIYNFLRFSDKTWKWIDNSIQPQNRLRLSEYRKIFEELRIPFEVKDFRPGNKDDLLRIKLNKKYHHYSSEDLAVSHAYVLSRK